MLTTENLPELIELFSWGFAIGAGGGVAAFILALIVNTFYVTADG